MMRPLLRSLFTALFCILPTLASQAFPVRNGDRSFSSGDFVVNQYARLAIDAAVGDLFVEVDDVAQLVSAEPVGGGPLRAGDLILLYQARGAQIRSDFDEFYGEVSDYGGAGNYELRTVARVDGNRIELEPVFDGVSCLGLRQSFRAAHSQVIRVPAYRRLEVSAAARLLARPWDGERGGVIALLAEELILEGEISASERGFRGGLADPDDRNAGDPTPIAYGTNAVPAGGHKGEGIASGPPHVHAGRSYPFSNPAGNFDEGPAANGGGGGGSRGGGGGGGAHVDIDIPTYTAYPILYDSRLPPVRLARQGSPASYSPAWALDPAYDDPLWPAHPGGGRGGYSLATVDRDALSVPPGDPSWGGDWRRPKGGWGGHGVYWVGGNYFGLAFFGGGGGAGGGTDAGNGGPGGGFVLVETLRLSGTGRFSAEGGRGGHGGALVGDGGGGGGGGGGSVKLNARDLSAFAGQIILRGGRGGDHVHAGALSAGPGGGGGGGVFEIASDTGSFPPGLQIEVEGGPPGETRSSSLAEFPENGATAGFFGAGRGRRFESLLSPDCDRLSFVKEVLSGAPYTGPGQEIRYRLNVLNSGERPIQITSISDPLLPGLVCSPGLPQSLAPGASMSCEGSYFTTATDVANGSILNEATLAAQRESGGVYGPLRAQALAVAVPAGAPALALSKEALLQDGNGSGRAEPGERIRYRLRVQNTGTVPLSQVLIDDPMLNGLLSCTPLLPATLLPGESALCEAEYTVRPGDLNPAMELVNQARASARAGAQDLEDTANAVVPLGLPLPVTVPAVSPQLLVLLALLLGLSGLAFLVAMARR